MLFVQNYPFAVFLCFIAMVCWGSWQNTHNFCGKSWRFELFYWDYSLGILLMSLFYAFTLGSLGNEGRTFIADVAQADHVKLLSAVLGGVIWNLGTLLLVAAISISGMATAFTIGGGLAWILGIILNFIAKPEGNINLIILGLVFILAAVILSYFAYKRLADKQKKPTLKAVLMAVTTGILIAFYYYFVASTLVTDFNDPSQAGKITPYTAVVFFSLGAFLSTFVYNSYFMRYPVSGPKLSIKDYFQGTRKQHLLGIAGGIIWCTGNAFSFMASSATGPAISYALSNAAPMVASIWGVFIWKEFREAPKGTSTLLLLMFLFYAVSLFIMTIARG